MAATLTLDVKEHHIKHGVKGDCKECPIALALCEFFELPYVSVNGSTASIFDLAGNERYHFTLALSAQAFIGEFDNLAPFARRPDPRTVSMCDLVKGGGEYDAYG